MLLIFNNGGEYEDNYTMIIDIGERNTDAVIKFLEKLWPDGGAIALVFLHKWFGVNHNPPDLFRAVDSRLGGCSPHKIVDSLDGESKALAIECLDQCYPTWRN